MRSICIIFATYVIVSIITPTVAKYFLEGWFSRKPCENQFVYIPTVEGLISQFNGMRNFWSHIKLSKQFYTILHDSVHFPGMLYSMCDVFEFGDSIMCLNITADEVIQNIGPDVCQLKVTTDWLDRATSYHMADANFRKVRKVKDLRLNQTDAMCVLGGPLVEENEKDGSKLKMDFHPRLYYYLEHAKKHLGIIADNEEQTVLKHYMVVHWRRGDQLKTRCRKSTREHEKYAADFSINCASATDLADEIDKTLSVGHIQGDKAHEFFWRDEGQKPFCNGPDGECPLVYIATNQDLNVKEDGKTMRDIFKDRGFKTFVDLELHQLNDLNAFLTELHMMVDADYYMAWGSSSIHQFVKDFKEEREHPKKYKFVRKRTQEELDNACDNSIGRALNI